MALSQVEKCEIGEQKIARFIGNAWPIFFGCMGLLLVSEIPDRPIVGLSFFALPISQLFRRLRDQEKTIAGLPRDVEMLKKSALLNESALPDSAIMASQSPH